MKRGKNRGHFVGPSVRVPKSACLDCGKQMDGATGVDYRGGPQPGHITICIGCGHIMAFAEDMRLRKLTDTEMIEIAGDRRLIAVQRARKLAMDLKR
jgi:hypothetical protein